MKNYATDTIICDEPYFSLMLLINTNRGKYIRRMWNRTVAQGEVTTMTGEGYRKHSVGAILSWDGISAVSAAALSALDVQLGTHFEIAELAPHYDIGKGVFLV